MCILYSSLFVTWKKGKGNGLRLRGCIGTLEPRHMHSAVGDYALTRCEPTALPKKLHMFNVSSH